MKRFQFNTVDLFVLMLLPVVGWVLDRRFTLPSVSDDASVWVVVEMMLWGAIAIGPILIGVQFAFSGRTTWLTVGDVLWIAEAMLIVGGSVLTMVTHNGIAVFSIVILVQLGMFVLGAGRLLFLIWRRKPLFFTEVVGCAVVVGTTLAFAAGIWADGPLVI